MPWYFVNYDLRGNESQICALFEQVFDPLVVDLISPFGAVEVRRC